MPRLNLANYSSRRIKLREHLAAAQYAHADAEFRRELETATDADVKTAREAVEALESRLKGLDMAWARTLEEDTATRAQESEASRLSAAKAQRKNITERTAASSKMSAAVKQLAGAYVDFVKAGDSIIDQTSAQRAHYRGDRAADLREAIHGQFADVKQIIVAQLKEAGLNISGVTVGMGQAEHLWQRDVAAHTAWSNERVAPHLLSLSGAE